MKKVIITSPIYYANNKLHLGHVYTNVICDSYCRFYKKNCFEVFFTTGMDEHGDKVFLSAKEKNMPIDLFLDNITKDTLDLWKKYNIEFTNFIRTSDQQHIKTVKDIFFYFFKKKIIYTSNYEGYYSLKDEAFLSKKELKNLKNKDNLVFKKEESFFLKIEKQKELLKEIKKRLLPKNKVKELEKNFFSDLKDLSITRENSKNSISLEINNKNLNIYVWFDALINYLSAFNFSFRNQKFFDFWNSKDTKIIQFIGKEIVRFHTIYWFLILKYLKLKIPNNIISHGWLLLKNEKMSKSEKNIICPHELLKKFSSDEIRYFLTKNFSLKNDFSFSIDSIANTKKQDLIFVFSNLVTRTLKMIEKYFNGQIKMNLNNTQVKLGNKWINEVIKFYETYKISASINFLLKKMSLINKKIQLKEPWKLYNQKKMKSLEKILLDCFFKIFLIVFLLSPVLVTSYKNFILMFEKNNFFEELNFLNFINLINNKEIKIKEISYLFKND
ncbi:methionine--tRNA ligase [symbiont of Argiope bruennichi]|uniref:methionine--tRNA ligase n=1 Tax=symbiont of Argiope bruennichi TaxID=2810479 RepID=UPI003DA57BC7